MQRNERIQISNGGVTKNAYRRNIYLQIIVTSNYLRFTDTGATQSVIMLKNGLHLTTNSVAGFVMNTDDKYNMRFWEIERYDEYWLQKINFKGPTILYSLHCLT